MFLIGLLVGSFLNVVIYRLPVMLEQSWREQCQVLLNLKPEAEQEPQLAYNLLSPRSRCRHCNSSIGALDNIPIISYLILRGRCRHCSTPISLRYPAIELTSALLCAGLAWYFGPGAKALLAMLLTWALLCLSMIDVDKQLLPDDITLPFLWLGLAANIFHVFTTPVSALMGVMLGYLVLWLIYQLFRLLTGKEGMGFGDFKLLAMLGAWTGWQMIPLIVLLASVAGSIIGVGLMIFRNHEHSQPIPFGPYLALAGWVALLWGRELNQLYLSFT